MKKNYSIITMLFLSLLWFGSLMAQPTIDGSFDGEATWGSPVATADGTTGWAGVSCDKLYATSDADYAYFAVTFLDAPDGWMRGAFAINSTTGGGSACPWGTAVSYGYANNPDFVFVGRFSDNWAEKRSWNGSSFDGTGTNVYATDIQWAGDYSYVEMRISLSDLGYPLSVDVQYYVSGNNAAEHGTFDAVPDDEVAADWNYPTTLDNYQSNIFLPLYTIGAGDWSNGSSWNSGSAPADNAAIVIAHAITQDQNAIATDLSINSGASLTINPTFELTVNGTLTNNGTLTIKSDATGTGSLIESDGVNADVERYLTPEQWHYISLPVSPVTSTAFTGLYLMEWDEPTEVWSFIEDLGISLNTSMQGYATWAPTTAATVSMSGALNQGSYSIGVSHNVDPVSDNSGFNFVGNPYPSALDWDASSGWTLTNVGNSIYIWNQTAGNYGVYVKGNGGSGTNSVTNEIPQNQGFFVYCTDDAGPSAGSGTLAVGNDARIHASQDIFKNEIKSNSERISFKINGNGYGDEMIVALNPNSTPGFDVAYDAKKFNGSADAPQMFTLSQDETQLSVNALPEVEKSIMAGVKVGTAGFYEFTLNEIVGFENMPLYLEDLQESKVIDLISNNNYKFYATPNDNPNRFVLHFSNQETPVNGTNGTAESLIIYPEKSSINFSSAKGITGSIEIYNLLGQQLVADELSNSTAYSVNVNENNSLYIVKIKTDTEEITKKVFVR